MPEQTKPSQSTIPAGQPVAVWDAPIRLFHWLVVILVAAAYVTVTFNWMDWHVWIGEALLALVIFRLLWGCFGGQTARFRGFVTAPGAALHHLRHAFVREADRQVGHNPAGGWMVMLLLALLLVETLSGIYLNNDIANDGPFTEWIPAPIANAITALHSIVWDVLLAAVALHVLVIVLYAAIKGHNLIRPMLTGRKRLPDPIVAPRQASALRALLLMTIAAIAAAIMTTYL